MREHSIKGFVGMYQAPSKTYSRERCLKTMLDLNPDLKIIYVKDGPVTFEKAYISRRPNSLGIMVWHFYASHKVADVEAPSPPSSSC